MVGMSAGNLRSRFDLERFSDLADGMAIESRIIAAGNVQAVDPADKQPAVCTELAAVGSSTDLRADYLGSEASKANGYLRNCGSVLCNDKSSFARERHAERLSRSQLTLHVAASGKPTARRARRSHAHCGGAQ
jgi:hypothetical protein